MECSKCGHKFDDGLIFCPECGAEVHIVPEFQPEIELSIEESIQNIVTDVNAKASDDEALLSASEDDAVSITSDLPVDDVVSKLPKSRFFYLFTALCSVALIALIIFISVMFYRDNSASYQVKMGDKAYKAGSYKDACAFYKKAIQLDPDDLNTYFQIAECYKEMGNIDMAIDEYTGVISRDPSSTLAFSNVISIYEDEGDYSDIDLFLHTYASDDIKTAFVDYLADPPEFSHDDGSYDSSIVLSLSVKSEGKVYYTDDGTKPDEGSKEYKEPLMLKKGKHFIQAVFVNKYGVVSPVMSHTYNILAEAPAVPMVSLDSGEYDKPQLVRVIVPEDCFVYYTLDGTDPDEHSRIYGDPIPVSDGVTVIKFVSVNSRGLTSEVLEKEYNITVEKMFDEQTGCGLLKNHLVSIGYITDLTGTSPIYPGRFDYLFSEMRYIGNRSLYCYNEYYLFGSGAKSMTGNVFAIDCMTGEIFLVKRGGGDAYSISPF